jgi:hypothetical protein
VAQNLSPNIGRRVHKKAPFSVKKTLKIAIFSHRKFYHILQEKTRVNYPQGLWKNSNFFFVFSSKKPPRKRGGKRKEIFVFFLSFQNKKER